MQNIINHVILEEVGHKLLDARTRKGLSQRALAERTGVPQAHISKIEQGRVDIRVSSLVELARALDLDVQLLPRQVLPAVEGAVRAVESEIDDSAQSRALATLARQQRALEHIQTNYPDLTAVQKLLPTIRELKLYPYDAERLKALERAIAPAEQARVKFATAGLDGTKLGQLLERANRNLRTLRNAHAHGPSTVTPRSSVPAYRLDDGDDDD
ncbi:MULTISPECIES: helix-turn-helix domain-containing protein [unclassified Sphingomonas]|uniref:helix-turn-helix domain-containing protein n=1 Tax=unclassified Sphingomonas TaxID=196159 RepID=UPI00082D418E|nr:MULTISPECIES: helix-turn-helix transcriptional regulator [unclassified Sphingomonas]